MPDAKPVVQVRTQYWERHLASGAPTCSSFEKSHFRYVENWKIKIVTFYFHSHYLGQSTDKVIRQSIVVNTTF